MKTTLLVVLVVCVCVDLSFGCSCFPDKSPDRFCRYDIIVRGTAVAEYKELEDPYDHSDPYAEFNPFADWVYTVKIDQPIMLPKNMSGAETFTMRTPTQESLCGRRFVLDVNSVFFARFNYEGEITTGLCDPNTAWENLSEWEQGLITDHIVDYCTDKANGVTPPEP